MKINSGNSFDGETVKLVQKNEKNDYIVPVVFEIIWLLIYYSIPHLYLDLSLSDRLDILTRYMYKSFYISIPFFILVTLFLSRKKRLLAYLGLFSLPFVMILSEFIFRVQINSFSIYYVVPWWILVTFETSVGFIFGILVLFFYKKQINDWKKITIYLGFVGWSYGLTSAFLTSMFIENLKAHASRDLIDKILLSIFSYGIGTEYNMVMRGAYIGFILPHRNNAPTIFLFNAILWGLVFGLIGLLIGFLITRLKKPNLQTLDKKLEEVK